MSPHIFRLRFVLKAMEPVRLHPHQAGLLYAVLAEANGMALNQPPALPEGLLLEAVEQCRTRVERFSTYAFGATLLASSVEEAHQRVRLLRQGLRELAQARPNGRAVFRGNFRLAEVSDLVADRELYDDNRPTPIPPDDIAAEIAALTTAPRWTLRFLSPLRMSRSKHDREGRRHAYFDRRSFAAEVFLRRTRSRLEKLGILAPSTTAVSEEAIPPDEAAIPSSSSVAVLENRLVWLDVAYGGGSGLKSLGGAVGDVTLGGLSRREIETLVWGQYVHVGENTRFGHGRYRIAQSTGRLFGCARTERLIDLAFVPGTLDAACERYDLEPGQAGQLVREVRTGQYQPDPPVRVELRTSDKVRWLSVPRRADRAIQRALLDHLGPALEPFFENSSLAYRPGRGRHDAPDQLRGAYSEGFRWALRADFSDFFNTVDHEELQHRLHAYIADPALVGLLMKWVRNGSPEPDRGLPTGAVVSPLLANLFLDEFDEAVSSSQARLIRYADDFVLLFRTEEEAREAYAGAAKAAEELCLTLNERKTELVDLTQPFEWLGFRFFQDEEWHARPLDEPRPIEQLGWFDATRIAPSRGPIRLPGESDERDPSTGALVIAGPGVQWLDVRDETLRIGRRGAESSSEIPWDRVEGLVCLGYPSPSSAFLRRMAEGGVPVAFASDAGAGEVWLAADPLDDPELVTAQTACRADAAWRLEIARLLVSAKLENYAALAAAAPHRKGEALATERLRELAEQARKAETIARLLGYEGAGAAEWYRSLGGRVSSRFQFDGRHSPGAEDPLNILLNIGFTALYRELILLLKHLGFSPSLGVLHEGRRGHAALASDLQEPFRHLVDRAVIEASHDLSPGDFKRTEDGPFPVKLSAAAHMRFRAALHVSWKTVCRPVHAQTGMNYQQALAAQCRSLRRHLLDRGVPFVPFRHPPAAGGVS